VIGFKMREPSTPKKYCQALRPNFASELQDFAMYRRKEYNQDRRIVIDLIASAPV